MRKRILALCAVAFLCLIQGNAVLKERDLARTLGVLKAELQAAYEKQQAFMARYEQQGAAQHQQLVKYMQQCEQIGLMLYSQSTENTFDMAYACQQATSLYRHLNERDSKMLQYDRIITHIEQELERYDALIASLKSIPPIVEGDSVLTESDTILLAAIDSLAAAKKQIRHSPANEHEPADMPPPPEHEDEVLDELPQEPLFLTGEQLKDRADCLLYADTLRGNMQVFLESMQAESSYYKSVRDKVKELNQFAQGRYQVLRDNIFINGSNNYFSILSTLPMQYRRAVSSMKTKYAPFKGHASDFSEWRGAYVLFISLFLVIYISLALFISYVIMRWLVPRRWLGEDYQYRRKMLIFVIGIALFALFVMAVRTFADRNFIQMGTGLIINMAWLLEAIFLSLYIRLKGEQMIHAAKVYAPLMLMTFVVIIFRITLAPNIVVNLIFPLLALLFAVWQVWLSRRYRSSLPLLDTAYIHITTTLMIVACVASWIGYTLLAVQIMIWWTFQLAALTTITCLYDLMEMYENRYIIFRIRPELKEREAQGEDISEEVEQLREEMRAGFHISKTWIYDLVSKVVVPIAAVLSVPFSFYWAAEVFEMTSLCYKVFTSDFLNLPGLIRLSLSKVCLVVALWFLFRYLAYCIRSIYVHYRQQLLKPGSEMNLTLARNVTGILVWGLYLVIAMVLLEVPWSGISLVTAGLATGLGFAMQNLLENFFYGISLMTGRLHVGDYIECDGIQGKVESITYQSTQITTMDGCVIAFLNSTLFSKNFKNLTRNHRYELVRLPIGVAYGTDIEEVRRLVIQAITPVCSERNADGQCVTNIHEVAPKLVFVDFGESSVDLAVVIWMLVEEKIRLSAAIRETIYETLRRNGIEIPFPQRDVYIKS